MAVERRPPQVPPVRPLPNLPQRLGLLPPREGDKGYLLEFFVLGVPIYPLRFRTLASAEVI